MMLMAWVFVWVETLLFISVHIAIELETLKINSNESYLDFCYRIHKKYINSKIKLISNTSFRESKIIIYNYFAMNVFLYNLPEDLLRIVQLWSKVCSSLENALSIVLEEVNFVHQYNSRNKMLIQPHSNTG